MSLAILLDSVRHRLSTQSPLLLYAATWTALLTLTVAIASFSPEFAFVSAISSTSSSSGECDQGEGYVRVPLDNPGEVICLHARTFTRSTLDLVVPPVFAAVVVAGSTWAIRAVGLWEDDEAR